MTAPGDTTFLTTFNEMCRRLHIGRGTGYKLINKGEVESLLVEGARRIVEPSIDAYIARQLAKSATHER